MKKILGIISAIMALATLTCSAFSIAAKAETQDDYIYYSDLFYGYDADYLLCESLQIYTKSTDKILTRVYNEYVDSDEFFWTTIKDGIKKSTNLREWVTLVSDANGNSDYTYEKALDKACQTFAQTLLSSEGKTAELLGTGEKVASNMRKIFTMINDLSKQYDFSTLSQTEVYSTVFNAFSNSGILLRLPASGLSLVFSKVLEDPEKYSKYAGNVSYALGGAQAIIMGLLFEDVRMEAIDAILEELPEDSSMYIGLSRFRSTMEQGFLKYFVDYYLTEKVMTVMVDKVVKKLTVSVFGNAGALYNIVGAGLNIAATVVFDVIMDVPGIDDLTTQVVLMDFTNDLWKLIKAKIEKFGTGFSYSDIYAYEVIVQAYYDTNYAALTAAKKLALDSNEDALEQEILAARGCCYRFYVNEVKYDIETDDARRYKSDYTYSCNASTQILPASDDIEENCLYTCQGALRGNLYVGGTFTIPTGEVITIDGDVNVYKFAYTADSGAHLINNGTLTVTGDLNIGQYGTSTRGEYYGTYKQDNMFGYLRLGGDFYVESTRSAGNCNITDGKILFCGTETQSITGLRAYNVTVDNANGIYLNSALDLYGHINLHGNPITGSPIYMNNGATFADGSDYKSVTIAGSVTLKSNIKANVYVSGTLTVPEDESYTIDGDLSVYKYATNSDYGAFLTNNGTLTVTGNIIIGQYSSNVNGEYYGTFKQSDDAAVLIPKGDITFDSDGSAGRCYISGGTVVFDGEIQQMVNNLTAYNVTVTNPEGINLQSTLHLYGHIDLKGNPIAGSSIYMYNGATFADGSDYGSVSITGSVTLKSNVKADVYVSGNLTIPEGESYTIDGDVTVYKLTSSQYYGAYLTNNGTLTVTGSLNISRYTGYGNRYYGTVAQSNNTANLILCGDFILDTDGGYCKISGGTVTFDGAGLQTVSNLSCAVLILDNPSKEGIVFTKKLQISKLFDHRQNVFTVSGSTSFVDYDGVGQKDNVDPYPASVYNNGVWGDADGDGEFTNADLTLAIRLVSGWHDNGTALYMADANADRRTNNRDIIALVQKIAGWI